MDNTEKTQNESIATLFASAYGNFVRESEQLRILKNFVELAEVYSTDQIKTLIRAMEANNE